MDDYAVGSTLPYGDHVITPRKRKRSNTKLPERWGRYTPTGQLMDKVRIIAFKTPLDETFFDGKGKDGGGKRFTIKTFIQAVREKGVNLGFVIDLTDTTRYYNKHEWREHSIEYLKIHCPGHTVDRSERFVNNFTRAVKEFFSRNIDNGKVIGVHCTHGLNRTGYMICRYLIDELQYSAKDAIQMFETCRGHAMERYKLSLNNAEQRRIEKEGALPNVAASQSMLEVRNNVEQPADESSTTIIKETSDGEDNGKLMVDEM